MNWESEFAIDYSLSADQMSKFRNLLSHLSGISDRNLTAVTGEKGVVDFHFRDSLSLMAISEFASAEKIVDVGSGAGFPGLPLAIASPEKSFFLIEATSKKCDFIDESVKLLGLGNVVSIRSRAETAARTDLRDSFDLAVARAVGPLPVVIEYVMPLLKIGGHALLQRGSRDDNDESSASFVAGLMGARLDRVERAQPYPGSKNLHVWVFTKTEATPERFPRRSGTAKKRPLSS